MGCSRANLNLSDCVLELFEKAMEFAEVTRKDVCRTYSSRKEAQLDHIAQKIEYSMSGKDICIYVLGVHYNPFPIVD